MVVLEKAKRRCRCTHTAFTVDFLALDANCRQSFAVHTYPNLIFPSFFTSQNGSGLLVAGNPNTAKDCSDTWTTARVSPGRDATTSRNLSPTLSLHG